MGMLAKARNRSNGIARAAYDQGIRIKAAGGGIDFTPSGLGAFAGMAAQSAAKDRYNLNHGWVNAAINALAMAGAGQPFVVARIKGKKTNKKKPKDKLTNTKSGAHYERKMTKTARMKTAVTEYEVLEDHELIPSLNHPNDAQGLWQLVYSFIFNINLTGWGYIVAMESSNDDIEGKTLDLYSVPTTYIKPVFKDGRIEKFVFQKPGSTGEGVDIPRENVGFGHIPNPADPMGALPPAQSQMPAIRIDDHIQTCQELFFENGVFPSVIVTVGKDPHPDVPGGIRPRLSQHQRRQVNASIKKAMAGVSNYGNPAIIDGLIESIEKLSATQNEIGWEKSEATIRDRILSAFSVHPFILGGQMAGSYAQANIIKDMFFGRVNTYLDMLGRIVTNLCGTVLEQTDIVVWWEQCVAVDPSIRSGELKEARKNGDITKNEYRAEIGFAPDESVEEEIVRNKLLDSVGGMTGATTLLTAVSAGQVEPDSAAELVALFFEIPIERAKKIVGDGPLDTANPVAIAETQHELGQQAADAEVERQAQLAQQQPEEPTDAEAVKALRLALAELQQTPAQIAGQLALSAL